MLLLAALPAGAQTTDYDGDDDGLIEVSDVHQLYAIRRDLDGNGDATHANYVDAFPGRATGAGNWMGCPAGTCTGYELANDLDFDGDGDGDVDIADYAGTYWGVGQGWTPIGSNALPYSATFEGNGHTIFRLFINRPSRDQVGLFGVVNTAGGVRNVGLSQAHVTGRDNVGALAGSTANGASVANVWADGRVTGRNIIGGLLGRINGPVTASYSRGAVTGSGTAAGGLAGQFGNSASVTAVYATGAVSGNTIAGGLTGQAGTGTVTAAYATGAVSISSGTFVGGLAGNSAGTWNHACYDRETTGQQDNTGKGEPKFTADLQEPAGYTGIYADWNVDLDGDDNPDNPWDFGGPEEYPLLSVDFDGDGRATWEEFGSQHRILPPGPPAYNPAHDHPEIYHNIRYLMGVSCAVETIWRGDTVTTATLNFNLGRYTRPVTLVLSLWDGNYFRTLQSQGLPMPELQRRGRFATVSIDTHPPLTRFRIDTEHGLNLMLGYADCSTDDP